MGSTVKRRNFTPEFRQQVVAMVLEEGQRATIVAKSTGVGKSTLDRWLRIARKGGKDSIQESDTPVTEEQRTIQLLRRQVKKLESELDILKKALPVLIEKPSIITA